MRCKNQYQEGLKTIRKIIFDGMNSFNIINQTLCNRIR